MSIEHLIESIGLGPGDLKGYLLAEIDEFLEAEHPADKEKEFGDVLFALMSMAWAHSGRHFTLDSSAFEPKVKERLRRYAALTRHPRKYFHDRIPELKFGVVHFAFGQFTGQWTEFDPLKNGTVAEIHLLTEAPFKNSGEATNHCIVTFDKNDSVEYAIIGGSSDTKGGNTVLCRIPDFMFTHAKTHLKFGEFSEYLALQVLAALDGLEFEPGMIAHFYSWECGFLTDSEEFRSYMRSVHTIFSPCLTVGRLKALVEQAGGADWTMTADELGIASEYERKLSGWSKRVVLESMRDQMFYRNWVHPDRIDLRSFARYPSASFRSDPIENERLTFVAGGRPVREKGLIELCREFAYVRDWAAEWDITVSLSILCRERRLDKGFAYIEEVERTIIECGLEDVVKIEPKVSLDQLRRRIASTSAVIVSSLYDPFCLMPTYAVEAGRPAFVSCHAGVSENIRSREFTFDPQVEGDLRRAIVQWYEDRPFFEYESRFPNYRDLYCSPQMIHNNGNR